MSKRLKLLTYVGTLEVVLVLYFVNVVGCFEKYGEMLGRGKGGGEYWGSVSGQTKGRGIKTTNPLKYIYIRTSYVCRKTQIEKRESYYKNSK